MQLELGPEERDLIQKIAERALGELKAEVRRTSTPDYHDELKKEEQLLAGLIERIAAL